MYQHGAKSGDTRNFMTATDGVDIALGSFHTAMGALSAAASSYRASKAYDTAIRAFFQQRQELHEAISMAHSLADQNLAVINENEMLRRRVAQLERGI